MFEGPELPTGGFEPLAVIIAQGLRPGPRLWLTSNIHGNEVAGITVIHRLLTGDLCAGMRGAIVAMPSLNPAGLRTHRREPYYDARDPNRTFPGRRRDEGDPREPSVYERLARRLLETLRDNADYYIDLHCASLRSTPYAIRDRVLYKDEGGRAAAKALSEQQGGMLGAFGFPQVTEYKAQAYVARELHRSTTGAVLQELGKPAFTAELGAHSIVDPPAVDAAVIGIRNVMRWAGMLDGRLETMPHLPRPADDRQRRREDAPYPERAGILEFCVRPGDMVSADGVIAKLRDVWGRPLGDGTVRATSDAWVVGLNDGVLAYPGEAIAHLAVVDDAPLVEPWPRL